MDEPKRATSTLSDVHISALDGIRGVAILLVMIFHMTVMAPVTTADHAWVYIAGKGGAGVDVFFVLSGFLITGILLDARGGRGNYKSFYGRRILRIFPLYYAVVAFCLLILPQIPNPKLEKFGSVQRDAIWYWLHLSNFAIAHRGQFVHGILDVSWSLAIEEQFYLVWPAIALVLRPRTIGILCCVLIVTAVVSRVTLYFAGVNAIALYTLTFCRTDGLAAGALLALIVRNVTRTHLMRPMKWTGLLGAAAIPILAWPTMSTWHRAAAIGLGHSAWSAVTAWLIFACLPGTNIGIPAKLLRARWLIAFGRVSYGMYLFHYPIMAVIRDALYRPTQFLTIWQSPLPGQLLFYCISIGATFAAAWLSWHAFEKHFLMLKRFFPMQKPSALRVEAAEVIGALPARSN